jgi:Uma2 family endonuclease
LAGRASADLAGDSAFLARAGLDLRGAVEVHRDSGSQQEASDLRRAWRLQVWLVDPIARILEVYSLDGDRRWRDVRVYEGDARVRAQPFEAIELDLAGLWAR